MTGGDLGLQPLPVLGGETREPVDLLDQDDITAVTVGQEAEKLGPGKLGAALVLNVPGGDRKPAVGGERFELGTGTGRVLVGGRGSEIGPHKLHATLGSIKVVHMISVRFKLSNHIYRTRYDPILMRYTQSEPWKEVVLAVENH